MSEIAKIVAERVERARRDLLDLTLRNPLLNYRPRRASGVDAVGESAADVFDALVKRRAPKPRFCPSRTMGGNPRRPGALAGGRRGMPFGSRPAKPLAISKRGCSEPLTSPELL